MGVAMFVVVDNPPADFDAFIHGRGLAIHLDVLETEAERLDLVPLTSFLSVSAADLEGMIDGLDVPEYGNLPDEEWYSPDAGLRTARGLIKAIDSGLFQVEPELRHDLVSLERVLVRAKQMGLRFHLSMEC